METKVMNQNVKSKSIEEVGLIGSVIKLQKAKEAFDAATKKIFADPKTVYIDICEAFGGGYDVTYCLTNMVNSKNDQDWHNEFILRQTLIDFAKENRMNYWDAYRYDEVSGNVMPFENSIHDLDEFLDEYYKEVVKEYLESEVVSC